MRPPPLDVMWTRPARAPLLTQTTTCFHTRTIAHTQPHNTNHPISSNHAHPLERRPPRLHGGRGLCRRGAQPCSHASLPACLPTAPLFPPNQPTKHQTQSLRGPTTTNFAAWAGEEDKAAWAGVEDPMRFSANALRISDGLPPMAAEPALSKSALSLAQDLVSG